MIVLESVALAANKETTRIEHPDGIMVDDNGKTYVNISSGERLGVKRPFVVFHLAEQLAGNSNKGAHRDATPYWGTFTDPKDLKSRIIWQQNLSPNIFLQRIKTKNNTAIDIDFLLTKHVEVAPEDLDFFENMNRYQFDAIVEKHGLKWHKLGAFVTLPDRTGNDMFDGVEIMPYKAGNAIATSATTFVYHSDLNNLGAVLDAFVAKHRVTFIKQTGMGRETLDSPVMREARLKKRRDQATQIDPRDAGNSVDITGVKEPVLGGGGTRTEEEMDSKRWSEINEKDPSAWTSEERAEVTAIETRADARKK